MKRAIILALIGGLVGYAVGLYDIIVAKANFVVRPELAQVDFWTALFANHGLDWLVYYNQTLSVLVTAIIGAIIGFIIALWLKSE